MLGFCAFLAVLVSGILVGGHYYIAQITPPGRGHPEHLD